jgi:sporulation protein YlmC with PRC-barrel domain
VTYDQELFDIGLRLLDRQMVGAEDELLGNVDNLLLEMIEGRPTVTAIVSGPAGLGPRFGGRVEVWMRAIWRRLRPEADPAPVVIPMAHVERIEAAVTLDDTAQQLVADGAQLERWLRYYLIARIPGATGSPDRLAGQPLGPKGPGSSTSTSIPDDAHLISDLLGAPVFDRNGDSLGVVLDVSSAAPHPGRHRVGPLPLTHLLYGRRRLGAEMGYVGQRRQGPWLVAAPLRAWQRADRLVTLQDVTLDWNRTSVTLNRTAA